MTFILFHFNRNISGEYIKMFLNRIYSSTMPNILSMWLYEVDFWWLLLRRWAMWPTCLWLILISYTVYFKTDESIKARFYYLWETLYPNNIWKGIFWFAVIIFEISSSKGMENKRCQCLTDIKLWISSLMFFILWP